MSDDPATKADIADVRRDVQAVRSEVRSDVQAVRSDMQVMEKRLLVEIGHALNVAVEQIGKMVGVVDEKYQDLPERVVALEAHAADSRLHSRPPAPAKRSRRPKKK